MSRTNIDLDRFFTNIQPQRNNPFAYLILLTNSVGCGLYNDPDRLHVTVVKPIYAVVAELDALKRPFTTIRFRSHMRDFQIVGAFTPNEVEIARHQGIGVIVDVPNDTYIKLYEEDGKVVPIYTAWTHTDPIKKCRSILTTDLALGYDVFLIDSNGRDHRLCEEVDWRDAQETTIAFADFAHLADYHGIQRRPVWWV